MSLESPPDLLALHAIRILGFADTAVAARRFDLDNSEVQELLLDAEANGWVSRTAFAETSGWSLTHRGRERNEQQLAEQLARSGRAQEVYDAYAEFLPVNVRLLSAVTDWQLRPLPGDRLAPNDHSNPVWDGEVLTQLRGIGADLRPVAERLEAVLYRFRGYVGRYQSALTHAHAGDTAWVDRTDVDSCHRVWFELHEDLVATLGVSRGEHP